MEIRFFLLNISNLDEAMSTGLLYTALVKEIVIHPYNPLWPAQFASLGSALRATLGPHALAIHHIGSTSVPGLDAKDVLDVQLTVTRLDVPIRVPLENLGFIYRETVVRDHCPPGQTIRPDDLEKRYYFRPEPRVHLHVRQDGRYNQRYALLCRDYLRANPMARDAYAEIKRQLAGYFPADQAAYYAIKDPVFDTLMAGAFIWAEATNWSVPSTDA